MIRNLLWRGIAAIVSRPMVADWLIARALRAPYRHIHSQDGSSLYMGRWWLFNPYPTQEGPDTRSRLMKRMPSVRIHRIMRPDNDRDLHDHPWNARTIILRNWYEEQRRVGDVPTGVWWTPVWQDDVLRAGFHRERGYTGRLLFGEYHRISEVPADGVWTLFITWKKQGAWGFLVDGVKVPWRKYLGLET